MSVEKHQVHEKFIELFQGKFGFTDEEFGEVLSVITIRHLPKKEFYLQAGDITRHRAYINKGCTRTFVIDPEGHERILFFGFEDWWIGDFDSITTGKPGVNYVQAIEDCELLMIAMEDFDRLEATIPKMHEWNVVKVQRLATAMWKRVTDLRTLTPEERYIELIDRQPHIFARVPLHYIAAYLNIEPPSLSRMRKRLATKKS